MAHSIITVLKSTSLIRFWYEYVKKEMSSGGALVPLFLILIPPPPTLYFVILKATIRLTPGGVDTLD